MATGAHPL